MRRYRPRFLAAPVPDPVRGDWHAWEELLLDGEFELDEGPQGAMCFDTDRGFATVSSALIALPATERRDLKPVFRFAAHRPNAAPWRDVLNP